MKKFLLVLLILVVIGGAAFAFDPLGYPPPLDGGNFLLDIGAGLGYYGYDYNTGKFMIPPLYVSGQFALKPIPLSVGGLVTFSARSWSGYPYFRIGVYALANWHFGFDVDWLDLYAGIILGANIGIDTDPGWKGRSYFDYGVHVGAHFYFSRAFGLQVEAGWPYWIKAGLAFKF